MAGCPALLLFCRNNQRHWRNRKIFKKRKRIVLVKVILEKSESSSSKSGYFKQSKTEILHLRGGILGVDGEVGKGEMRRVYRQWEEKQTLLRRMWESRSAGLYDNESYPEKMNSDYLSHDIHEWWCHWGHWKESLGEKLQKEVHDFRLGSEVHGFRFSSVASKEPDS